ncbi:hypothetical protein [Clostridium tetanomorphum]|uniref:hypothetical protein n=1 Tax=Clostridium tetanomorphum TaxID=1553 RepID=UPI000D94B9E8|nr:hypothetical protein [Clostridium tetanomorphum]SQB92905.1 peptide ABC transporter permease [Clostridium tetanomorphum]
MLLGLAKKNIKGNFNNYFIYFVSIVFNVTIYFAFQNIASNNQVKAFWSKIKNHLYCSKVQL